MNTPTHLLISATALATSPADPVRPPRGHYMLILFGGIIPDLAIFIMFFWERLIQGVGELELWRDVYWLEPWQTLVAIGNSAPLYGLILLGGTLYRAPLVIVFSASALLHLLFDFPVHHDDARPHLWPFSDWRFVSPLSYWDRNHFGDIVSGVEVALALGLIIVLWRRFPARPVRTCLIVALLSYIAIPIYFALMIG